MINISGVIHHLAGVKDSKTIVAINNDAERRYFQSSTMASLVICLKLSGKSIAAFCRDEAISVGNFYAWRSKLRDNAAELPVAQRGVTFIDLGAVTSGIAAAAPEYAPPPDEGGVFLAGDR